MDLPTAMDLGRTALLTALIIAGPVLLAGVVVGAGISILQTVTQLQDQTINIVPKIVAMLAAALFFTPWLMDHLIEYTQALLTDW